VILVYINTNKTTEVAVLYLYEGLI
jgi:hypothetical protein